MLNILYPFYLSLVYRSESQSIMKSIFILQCLYRFWQLHFTTMYGKRYTLSITLINQFKGINFYNFEHGILTIKYYKFLFIELFIICTFIIVWVMHLRDCFCLPCKITIYIYKLRNLLPLKFIFDQIYRITDFMYCACNVHINLH